MKKLIALTLTATMALSLAACGSNDQNEVQKNDEKLPVSVTIRVSAEEKQVSDRIGDKMDVAFDLQYVDTLNDAVMAVKSDRADQFFTIEPTAKYLAARDDSLGVEILPLSSGLYMLTLEDSDLIASFNDTLVTLKKDGVLDALYNQYVTPYLDGEGEPDVVEIPVFEDADTITVGISGDIPPIDYVNADGEPIGFNLAVLAELAKQMEVNIKVETIDGGNRFAALSSERIDAFFWLTAVDPENMDGELNGYALTESYAEIEHALLLKKQK